MTRFSTLLGTLVILFAGACISPAEVDFAEAEQELVVYSHFGADEFLKIYLTHTRDPLESNQPFKPIENATIKVYRDGQLLEFELNRSSEPGKKAEHMALYDTDIRIVEGSNYQIEVIAEGYKNARSAETVPHSETTISHFELVENTDENKLYRLVFSDGGGAENYYQLIIKVLMFDMSNTVVSEEVIDYELVRSSASTHFENNTRAWTAIYPEYAGFLFTGVQAEAGRKELFIEIPTEDRTGNDNSYKYKVELHNVSEAYFLYHQSVYAQLTDSNPLNEPIRIYNNIEGGFGNFSAYNSVTTETDEFQVGERLNE